MFVDCLFKYLWNEEMALIREYKNDAAYNYQRKQALKMELAFGLLGNKRSFFHDIIFFILRVYIKLFVHYKLD